MKIAVNTRLLLPNRLEGIGWFTYETLKRLVKWHPEHEFLFIFDRPWDERFVFSDNVTPIQAFPPSRHPLLWYLWFEHTIPQILAKHEADLFLSPDGYLSLRANIPSVAVMHDINFYHNPKALPTLTSRYYRYFFPKYAHKASRIATVSEYSRNDISKHFEVPTERIDVVYNGANTIYKPLPNKKKEEIRRRYTGGRPFFIFIGSLHPRKNVERLLLAYERFRIKSQQEVKMVIVGEAMFKTRAIKNLYNNHQFKEDILFTGRLSADELQSLFPAAMALTFVPYFEGFGIPVLEAMYCDVPVLTSNITSLPEVAGNAALQVNPFSVKEIAEGMVQLANEPDLRKRLIAEGRKQRSKFSWDATASALWKTLKKAAQNYDLKL